MKTLQEREDGRNVNKDTYEYSTIVRSLDKVQGVY